MQVGFGETDLFGFSVAVSGNTVFVGAINADVGNLADRGDVSLFSLALPVKRLTVDSAFCALHGVANYSGDCIAAALAEAEVKAGAFAVVALAPGTARDGGLFQERGVAALLLNS